MKNLTLLQTKLFAHLVVFLICFVIIAGASETVNPFNFVSGGLFFIGFMQAMCFICYSSLNTESK